MAVACVCVRSFKCRVLSFAFSFGIQATYLYMYVGLLLVFPLFRFRTTGLHSRYVCVCVCAQREIFWISYSLCWLLIVVVICWLFIHCSECADNDFQAFHAYVCIFGGKHKQSTFDGQNNSYIMDIISNDLWMYSLNYQLEHSNINQNWYFTDIAVQITFARRFD